MIYKCEYCGEEFCRDYECRWHEEECWENPENQDKVYCSECKHYKKEIIIFNNKQEYNYSCTLNKPNFNDSKLIECGGFCYKGIQVETENLYTINIKTNENNKNIS